MKNLKGTAGETSSIFFDTDSVDIFSERASMCRERQGAVYEQTKSHSTKIVKPLHTLFYDLFSQLLRYF